MEDCDKIVQEVLPFMIYSKCPDEPHSEVTGNDDVDMGGWVDEENVEEVYSDREGWYGKMMFMLQPVLHVNILKFRLEGDNVSPNYVTG